MSGSLHRIETIFDPDLGAISVAVDEDGAIIASASSGIQDGVYTAVNEGSFHAATGQLLPIQLWEAALLEECARENLRKGEG